MSEPEEQPRPKRHYTTHDPAVDARIEDLVSAFPEGLDRALVRDLVVSAYRFALDKASTLDLKIVSSAVKELRHAFKIFAPYRHLHKVAIFGSARTPPGKPSYKMAEKFGHLMAKSGWMVITGAASGIMRAGHVGAGTAASFGLNIRLPFEQEANTVIAQDDKLVTCKYFFTRKLLFLKESSATVLFPGGFGTLDEGFECLTLVQTGKADPRPIVFVDLPGGKFWGPLLKFMGEKMVTAGMISPSDRSLYQVAHSPEEAAEIVLRFYRVYHSMRYVDHDMVLRLTRPLPEAMVDKLSREFKDILVSGKIRQGGPLPQEAEEQADEPELQKMTRLIFRFNRHDYGRLTQMINRINAIP